MLASLQRLKGLLELREYGDAVREYDDDLFNHDKRSSGLGRFFVPRQETLELMQAHVDARNFHKDTAGGGGRSIRAVDEGL